jgi:predicted Zn finger-like uncharacterized protein
MLVTTCPDCDTTFKLTVAILEKAGGQVRCGRCARIFDANSRLREQPETETERLPPAGREQTRAEADDASEFAFAGRAARTDDTSTRWYLREDPAETAPASAETHETNIEDTDAALMQMAPDDTGLADVAAAFPEVAHSEAAVAGTTVIEPTLGEPVIVPAAPESAVGRALEPTHWTPTAAASEAPAWMDEEAAPVRRRTWPWAVGTGLLTLTLAAQLIHAQRSDIAALPHVGPVLIAAYARFGRELTPPVVLDQYSTLDLTAVAEPVTDEHGWLIIETRVQNRGPMVQPYPYILVRLLDRWTETIAGRYFGPDEYLVKPLDDYSRMSAGTIVDAQFIIVDPGPSATGFELEFCTKLEDGFRCDSK